MTRGYAAIGLYQPKTPANVGSVLRAAHCFEVSMMALSGKRFHRSCVDTFQQWRHMPVIETADLRTVIPYSCVPVAVEIADGARSLISYQHPERAYYIFGPEDGSIAKDVMSWCLDIVYIPTKRCMNLAATVNVVLYDRMMKLEAA